jgi:DNA-binding SARP family transcriptional activator
LLELRRLFERSHEASEQVHLRVERDLLGIAQDSSLTLDLRLVESASKLVGSGVASPVGQAREELLARLEQAARLVRGPFLAGFTLRDSQFFDDWTSQHREHWHLRVHQVFDALSMLYEQGGDVERAIEAVSRWLNFDPLTEEGYRRLMRLRFSQGDRVGALRAYARGRAVLANELQVEPEPETVALAEHIRHTTPLRSPQVRNLQPSRAATGQPPADLLDGPFLGRSAEFGTLIERYQRAHAGQPQLVLLQGETGIGKTRLATEFVGWAQAQGADVLMGRALPTGRQLHYQPLIDVLRRRLEQESAPDDLGSPVWLAELSRWLPELRERSPDLPVPSTDEALGHHRLFEAIARLLQLWAARRPLVLWLDDMQWVDTATLDLVLYLARSLAEQSAPVLLLFTLSTGVESFTEAQSTWVIALKRTGIPLTARVLAAFTKEQTQHFVKALAWAEQPLEIGNGGSTDSCPRSGEAALFRDALIPFANWLYLQTRGQPLYLVETLKELLVREIISPLLKEDGSWCLVLRAGLLAETPVGELIPQALRELIRYQLARLTPSAWALLVAGAALGQGLSFERLIRVAQLDEQEGLHTMEKLLGSGLLREGTLDDKPQAFDEYTFPREMVRTVVYQEAGMTRQRLVQRHVSAMRREEESSAPSYAPVGGHLHAEVGRGQERKALDRAVHGDMRWTAAKNSSGATSRHAGKWMDEPTLPAASGAWEKAAPALPRSPPRSSIQSFF